MTDTAVAGGLMPHQKDEHDIWTCKDCGWKYPNAKPSPKIRKNHKKHCSGKAGADVHDAGSSDDAASDDEHHSSRKEGVAPNQTAEDSPVPTVESKDISFDFAAATAKEDVNGEALPPPAAVNGDAKEEAAHGDVSTPAIADKQYEKVEVEDKKATSGLMPHQKDEHDIWTCKDCGWKYPNAKPSAKVRKHHKKQCPGKGGPGVGGSSDEESDDEHHHVHHDNLISPEVKSKEQAEINSKDDLNKPRSFEPATEVKSNEQAEISSKDDLNKPRSFEPATEVESNEQAEISSKDDLEKPRSFEPPIVNEEAKDTSEDKAKEKSSSGTPQATVVGGLMPHQKDENDIWICKDCGWKYPNAKPSSKVRKHHKKQCPGKGGPGVGGSSDEESDDEHHHVHHDNLITPEVKSNEQAEISSKEDFNKPRSFEPATEVKSNDQAEISSKDDLSKPRSFEPATEVKSNEQAASEVAKDTSENKGKDESSSGTPPATGVGGLMPHQKDENDVWICKDCGWKYPNAKPSSKVRKHHKKQCTGKGQAQGGGGSSDEASDDEHHHGHHDHVSTPTAPPRLGEADNGLGSPGAAEPASNISREFLKETPSSKVVKQESTAPEGALPSAAEAAAVPDSINETEKSSVTSAPPPETGVTATGEAKDTSEIEKEEEPSPVAEAPPAIPRDINFGALQEPTSPDGVKDENTTKDATLPIAATEDVNDTSEEIERKEDSSAGTPEAQVGGLMPHQKDEHDIWICKDCGWKYPNAKPSGKVRKNHKKQCPGKGGPMVGGGSSDEDSDDEHHHRPLSTPAAFKESPRPDMGKEQGTSAEAPPAAKSRDIDFEALEKSPNPEGVKKGSTVPEEFPPIPGTQNDANTFGEEESSKRPGDVSFKEAILKETKMEEGDPKKPVSLREAIDRESKQETESVTKSEPTEATVPSGGLMPHQKDEADVWVCKACGWKYPNAKPSPKVKKNHKKKCPGNTSAGAVVAGGSSDEGTDNEQHSATG